MYKIYKKKIVFYKLIGEKPYSGKAKMQRVSDNFF